MWHTLRSYVDAAPAAIFETVSEIVARHSGITTDDILGKRQTRDIVHARRLVAVGCRYHALRTTDIAQIMGTSRQLVSWWSRTYTPRPGDEAILEEIRSL